MGAWIMDDEHLSKALATVLRHTLHGKGIAFSRDGFVPLSQVLSLHRFYDVQIEDVERVDKAIFVSSFASSPIAIALGRCSDSEALLRSRHMTSSSVAGATPTNDHCGCFR